MHDLLIRLTGIAYQNTNQNQDIKCIIIIIITQVLNSINCLCGTLQYLREPAQIQYNTIHAILHAVVEIQGTNREKRWIS